MDFYTSICTYYDNIFPFSPPQRDFVELTLKDIPDARILDIGCGTGNLAISLAVKGYRVVAIDYERAMIEAAEKKKITAWTISDSNIWTCSRLPMNMKPGPSTA